MKLSLIGGELRGCCPFHADRSPSFYVYKGGLRWICFAGCGGGDVLDFVVKARSVTIRQAAAQLCGGDLPLIEAPRIDARAQRDNAYALSIYRDSAAIEGTPAEAYLRRRGITLPIPAALRFARLKPPKDSGVAAANGARRLPAMVAVVTGPDGAPAGIQRTYLTEEGRKAATKATDADPKPKVKYSLGFVRGGAIRLGPVEPVGLALTEGAEDALSLMEMGAVSAWAAAGSGMLHSMVLPSLVRSVVIGADADKAGRIAAARAAATFTSGGRKVRVIYPSGGSKDFNEQLLNGRRKGNPHG